MANPVKKKWVSLKRFLQRLKLVDPSTIRGDGGAHSDKGLIVSRPQTDSAFVIKDTAVIAHPKKQ